MTFRTALYLHTIMELSEVYIPTELIVLFAVPLETPSEWTTFKSVCKLWCTLFSRYLERKKLERHVGTLWTLIHYFPDKKWNWNCVAKSPGTPFFLVKKDSRLRWPHIIANPNVPFSYLIERMPDWSSESFNELCRSPNFEPSLLQSKKNIQYCTMYNSHGTIIKFYNDHLKFYHFCDNDTIVGSSNLSPTFFERDPKLISCLGIAKNYGLSWSFYEKHLHQLHPGVWEELSRHPSVTWEVIENHPELPWIWMLVSCNPNITWETVKSHPDRPWNYEMLQYILPLEIILQEKEYFPELNMIHISKNCTIRANDVLDHPELEWCPHCLSFNLFENYHT